MNEDQDRVSLHSPEDKAAPDHSDFLIFVQGGHHFAIHTQSVEKLHRIHKLTRIWSEPKHIEGYMVIDGKAHLAINLCHFFALSEGETEVKFAMTLKDPQMKELVLFGSIVKGVKSVSTGQIFESTQHRHQAISGAFYLDETLPCMIVQTSGLGPDTLAKPTKK